jgi:hypothetical protein
MLIGSLNSFFKNDFNRQFRQTTFYEILIGVIETIFQGFFAMRLLDHKKEMKINDSRDLNPLNVCSVHEDK